jgi:hypothetical protein
MKQTLAIARCMGLFHIFMRLFFGLRISFAISFIHASKMTIAVLMLSVFDDILFVLFGEGHVYVDKKRSF